MIWILLAVFSMIAAIAAIHLVKYFRWTVKVKKELPMCAVIPHPVSESMIFALYKAGESPKNAALFISTDWGG